MAGALWTSGPRTIASLLARRNVKPSCTRKAKMAGDSWPLYKASQHSSGCFLFQRLIRFSVSGNKTTCHKIWEGPGFLMKTGSQQRNFTILLTICMLQRARNGQPIGLVTSVHFSETCDEDLPRLIAQVTTTIAPTPDRHALPEAHTVLAQRDLLAIRSIWETQDTELPRRWLRARQTRRSIW